MAVFADFQGVPIRRFADPGSRRAVAMIRAVNRKIVLINPQATYYNEVAQKCFPPMQLLYLAAALRDQHFDPVVLDANAFRLPDEEIAESIRGHAPLAVGISLYSDILRQIRDLTRLVRNACPESYIVLGGPHVSAVPVRTLEQFSEADYALIGEAEQSFPLLCEKLAASDAVAAIPGIVYRREGSIHMGPPCVFPELHQVPRPARDLVDRAYREKRYYSVMVRQKPVDTLFTSRGCPFHCGFCYNFRQDYRYRTAEDVVDELTRIASEAFGTSRLPTTRSRDAAAGR